MENIIDSLKWRYATKVFDKNKKISDEDFQKILDSLILTPSSFGLQPWKFVVVENPALREKLVEYSWNQEQVKDASHLIVLARIDEFSDKFIDDYLDSMVSQTWALREDLKGYEDMMKWALLSRPTPALEEWASRQVYIALWNALTVAASLWIDAVPMEGFVPEKYDEILGLKEMGLSSVLVLPLGYRSEEDKYASRPKIRYKEDEVVVRLK